MSEPITMPITQEHIDKAFAVETWSVSTCIVSQAASALFDNPVTCGYGTVYVTDKAGKFAGEYQFVGDSVIRMMDAYDTIKRGHHAAYCPDRLDELNGHIKPMDVVLTRVR